jgi:predicted RNase H-like nuclease (RuvC/YqgF family)
MNSTQWAVSGFEPGMRVRAVFADVEDAQAYASFKLGLKNARIAPTEGPKPEEIERLEERIAKLERENAELKEAADERDLFKEEKESLSISLEIAHARAEKEETRADELQKKLDAIKSAIAEVAA